MFFSFACFVTLLLCLSQHRMSGAGIILARQATDVYIMFALALFRFFRCTFQTCSTFGSLIYMVYSTDIKFFRIYKLWCCVLFVFFVDEPLHVPGCDFCSMLQGAFCAMFSHFHYGSHHRITFYLCLFCNLITHAGISLQYCCLPHFKRRRNVICRYCFMQDNC